LETQDAPVKVAQLHVLPQIAKHWAQRFQNLKRLGLGPKPQPIDSRFLRVHFAAFGGFPLVSA
jgi:hypothetical protein